MIYVWLESMVDYLAASTMGETNQKLTELKKNVLKLYTSRVKLNLMPGWAHMDYPGRTDGRTDTHNFSGK